MGRFLSRSLKIASVAGIGIYIHWTFLIVIGMVVFPGLSQGLPALQVLNGVAFVLALFLCIVLHELGHALTARAFGCRTKDIVIWLIGGVARLERLPTKPMQELLVAIAGPAVNVVIALVLAPVLILLLPAPSGFISIYADSVSGFLLMLTVANVVIVIFNLIPALPMDGGRVLRALLATRLSHVKATKIASIVGQIVAAGFVAYGLLGGQVMLAVIGLFVFFGARAEARGAVAKAMVEGKSAGDVMTSSFDVMDPHHTLQDAADRGDIAIVDQDRLVGVLSRLDVQGALRDKPGQTPLGAVMRTQFPIVDADEPLMSALERLHGQALGVVFEGDALAGLITPSSLASVLSNRARR